MDEMDALERQLAEVVRGAMRPPRPVDAATIVRSATTVSPRSRWAVVTRLRRGGTLAPSAADFSMSSALRFTAAAVVVALFGSVLLAGVLTAPQEDTVAPAAATESPTPAMTEELLSGLFAERIEPGILRVESDGIRFLSAADNRDVVAGYDGSVWLLRDGGFLRLGGDVFHAWPDGVDPEGYTLEVAPDGTLWIIPGTYWIEPSVSSNVRVSGRRAVLHSTDGETWTPEPCPGQECAGITVAPDGELWASWVDEGGIWRVGHLGSGGWESLDGFIPAYGLDHLTFVDDGEVYGVAFTWGDELYRHGDRAWRRITQEFLFPVRVGPDGTAWGLEGDRWNRGLARLADGEWSQWNHDELPEMAWTPEGDVGLGIGFDDGFQVAPDGSLWTRLWRGDIDVDSVDPDASMTDWEQRLEAVLNGRATCDGVVRFDGLSTDHFLPGRCLTWDFANDGSAWVLAESEDEYMVDGVLARMLELFVITPEALGTGDEG